MYSIRKKLAVISTAATAAMALSSMVGCVAVGPTQPDEYNSTPLVIDDAMQHRDWEPTTAYYESGDTVAGPTGFVMQPKDDLGYVQRQAIEIPTFLGNTAIMPFVLMKTPPGEDVTYRGAVQEPTYTAMPPLETDERALAREGYYE